MKKIMKLVVRSLTGAMMICALSAPSHAAMSNNELKIGISQEFENLNPMIMTMVASFYMYNFVGRALTTMNTDGKWYPQLAKSIPTL